VVPLVVPEQEESVLLNGSDRMETWKDKNTQRKKKTERRGGREQVKRQHRETTSTHMLSRAWKHKEGRRSSRRKRRSVLYV